MRFSISRALGAVPFAGEGLSGLAAIATSGSGMGFDEAIATRSADGDLRRAGR
jgi:hypothetical protein